MPPAAPELLVLAPLAVAAGIDLYLVLLVLGAYPTLGLWDRPLVGALADLDSPEVLLVVGSLYVLEFAAERRPAASLVWNGLHAIIRPLSGALLALLVLDGHSWPVVAVGAVGAGTIASVAHAVRSGAGVLRWLGSETPPHELLVSLLEDVLVLGLVALVLDLPPWALGATLVLAALATPVAGSNVRAFVFAVRLALARVFQTLRRRRWMTSDELPAWIHDHLEDEDGISQAGALRGSPVGAFGLPGCPRFVSGWVVVRGRSPMLLFRRRRRNALVELGSFEVADVVERAFYRRVDLRTHDARPVRVLFGVDGPSHAGLRAEFAP